MSDWTQYVKQHYAEVAHLPVRERFKALSEMRKGGKVPKAKGKGKKGGMLVMG